MGSRRGGGRVSEHGFGFEKFVKGEFAPFTAVAAPLVTAEGRREVEEIGRAHV